MFKFICDLTMLCIILFIYFLGMYYNDSFFYIALIPHIQYIEYEPYIILGIFIMFLCYEFYNKICGITNNIYNCLKRYIPTFSCNIDIGINNNKDIEKEDKKGEEEDKKEDTEKKEDKKEEYVFSERIQKYSNNIETIIKNDIDKITDSDIKDMISFAVRGGKRIRSLLIHTFNPENPNVNGILYIEYLHASSLIIDDIMDRDIIRRNRLSFYTKYGINKALSISALLLSMAMKHLNEIIIDNKISEFKKRKIMNYSTSIFENLCKGQYYDTIATDSINLDKIIEMKTSSLFIMSFLFGWIDDNREVERDEEVEEEKENEIEEVEELEEEKEEEDLFKYYEGAGKTFGLIFQLIDDIQDVEKDKSIGNGNNNYVCLHGKSKTLQMINKYICEYKKNIEKIAYDKDDSIIEDHNEIINNFLEKSYVKKD